MPTMLHFPAPLTEIEVFSLQPLSPAWDTLSFMISSIFQSTAIYHNGCIVHNSQNIYFFSSQIHPPTIDTSYVGYKMYGNMRDYLLVLEEKMRRF